MAVDLEALGRQPLDFIRTPMDVERLMTGATEEVVVMRALGQLVPQSTTRKIHFRQPPLGSEGLHVPIDGRQPERGHDPSTVLEDLVRRERALDAREDAADRAALTGVSLHSTTTVTRVA